MESGDEMGTVESQGMNPQATINQGLSDDKEKG